MTTRYFLCVLLRTCWSDLNWILLLNWRQLSLKHCSMRIIWSHSIESDIGKRIRYSICNLLKYRSQFIWIFDVHLICHARIRIHKFRGKHKRKDDYLIYVNHVVAKRFRYRILVYHEHKIWLFFFESRLVLPIQWKYYLETCIVYFILHERK